MFKFFMIVFEQSMIYLPVVLGAYMSFSLLKVPDLSLETAYLMGAFGAEVALQMTHGYSLPLSLLLVVSASIISGMLVGLLSSCITFYGKIPHLLSTIITCGLCQGFFLLHSSPYVSLARLRNVLMVFPSVAHHPELVGLGIVNFMICSLLTYFLSSQLGYSFAIFGHNPSFFKHFKISTGYIFMTGITIANGLAGCAGFLFAQTNSLVEMNMGVGKSLFCITALILGKTVVSQVQNSIFIPIVGVFLYFFVQQLLLKVGFDLKFFTMVQSVLVLLILLFVYKKDRAVHDQLGL